MSLVDNLAKRLSKTATLIQKEQIADHTYHLKIQGEDLKNLDYKPGEHVRILVGVDKATSMQHKVRTYSVWQYDHTNGVMDLAVCTHSTGIGSLWARASAIGDTIYLVGPRGRFTVDDSGDYYVFVGDPSALAHLYEINRNLTGHKQVLSLIYADREEDLFPDLDGSRPFQFNVLPRNSGETIIEHVHHLLKKATGKGMLYVGGDSRICVTLNRHFRHSLDWSSRQIKTKPFWAPGKIGLE